jgi:hypothetical protein
VSSGHSERRALDPAQPGSRLASTLWARFQRWRRACALRRLIAGEEASSYELKRVYLLQLRAWCRLQLAGQWDVADHTRRQYTATGQELKHSQARLAQLRAELQRLLP